VGIEKEDKLMIISRIILKNWRNFSSVDVELGDRMFIVGPNASGKSNFLDVFRFLRDIAKPQGGGLQKAIKDRGGLSKIRCLAARRDPNVEIEVQLSDTSGKKPIWKYSIGIKQKGGGYRSFQPYLAYEKVWSKDKLLLERPDTADKKDEARLTETHLEQINANKDFREIAKYFETVLYLHLIPQLLRYPNSFSGQEISGDPYGRNFLERVALTPERMRKSRLKKMEDALKIAVPQLKELSFRTDEVGVPHLEAIYNHWRARGAGKQREDQFSDGTLRLIGLLWSLLEGDALLLLEEPELSLHSGIVSKLPALMSRVQSKKNRQIIFSTHSADLLTDEGIGAEEVLLLNPDTEGTKVQLASSIKEVIDLLKSGLSIAEAVLPRTTPKDSRQLLLSF